MEFHMHQRIARKTDGLRGTVRHCFQFPGEPWKYTVDYDDGTDDIVLAEVLIAVDDDA